MKNLRDFMDSFWFNDHGAAVRPAVPAVLPDEGDEEDGEDELSKSLPSNDVSTWAEGILIDGTTN